MMLMGAIQEGKEDGLRREMKEKEGRWEKQFNFSKSFNDRDMIVRIH